jgi:hypothetical protein
MRGQRERRRRERERVGSYYGVPHTKESIPIEKSSTVEQPINALVLISFNQ